MTTRRLVQQTLGLTLTLLLLVGCGGASAEPTATTDAELAAFATELADITSRLREGLLAALTAPTDQEMKEAFATLAEINSEAQDLNVPDNEFAQELVPYLLDCTDHFHEDMSIDQFVGATEDCTLYVELFEELLGTDD